MKTVLSMSKVENVTVDIKLTGSEEFVAQVLWHLKAIEYMGSVGHSTMLGIDVDGDGSDRLRVECPWTKEAAKTLNEQANTVDSADVEVFTPRYGRRITTSKTETVWPKD